MNLPLIIDIAIGLVFIYLILSLLTSEIQEIIATLLQWRAEHLKKSIENLLTGDNREDPLYQKFVDDFYNSPRIRSLNQEAKGVIAVFFRKIVDVISTAYRTITRTRNVFGQQKSGPSYIPPETFSIALLQKINIEALSQKISELTARQFRDQTLEALREILDDLRVSLGNDPFLIGDGSLLEKEFKKLERTLENSVEDFVSGRASLAQSLEHIAEKITLFIDNAESFLVDDHPCKEVIRKRLSYLRQTISRKQLEPTITEVLRGIFAEEGSQTQRMSPWLTSIMAQLKQDMPELQQAVVALPQQLRLNLLSLAEQARLKANSLEDEVRQLEQEVADWFSNSMDRASGVYRRNAKGVAILVGFFVAILINADTLHMIDRLSKDTLLRSTVTQAAEQIAIRDRADPVLITEPLPPEPAPDAVVEPVEAPVVSPAAPELETDLQEVKQAVDNMLNELPLPIGWNPVNVAAQEQSSQGWAFPWLRRLIGWGISGIALSMGANFWFNLMSKVVKVRSTGKKPEDS
ncbi:MAG: hypothetical protein Kow00121_05040 [Elainellaceae cyanobacterium]